MVSDSDVINGYLFQYYVKHIQWALFIRWLGTLVGFEHADAQPMAAGPQRTSRTLPEITSGLLQ